MIQARIRIDGRDYILPPDHDAETVMGRITAQVRDGGGFVEIVRTPERTFSVLVSPGMSLSIEVTHVEDEPATGVAEVEESWWVQSSLDPLDML
ncbi:hypothetical protein [Agromyces humi]|uniref:hypothetical protein n=1 Tax=Agromyces humi TaxID=1766800 RepID=UPI0013582385|nr:hypothetical protein [Agromyces humi]